MPGEKIRILYVDDEPALLEVGKAFLERSGGISCDTALSPEEAIGRLKREHYDAIISDYQMPGVDGIEFLKFVRKRCGDIPFIIFTGKGREEVVIQALNNGADFYLQKGGDPLSQFAELEHKVKQAVGRFRAEEKLRRINRYNEIVIEVNTAASRCREKEPFLAEVCHALTKKGDYGTAWTGVCEVSGKWLVPVASCNSHGERSPPGARTPVGIDALDSPLWRKVFAGETVYTTLDSLPGLFQSHEAVQEPVAGTSVALVPLFVMGKVRGILCLSAARTDAFSPEEQSFIGTLGFTVSTAVERMEADEVRRRAEEALADSLRQMQDLIEFLPDPTFAIDRAGRVIAWNRAMEEMTGVRKSAILGKGDHEYASAFYGVKRPMLVDLVSGGDPGAARLYPGARRIGETVEAEVTLTSPGNGREVQLWVRAAPLFNRNGERVGAIETVRDITRIKETERSLLQKNEELAASLEEITAIEEELRQQMEEIAQNEQLLRESEERYRAIFENTGTATVIIGEDGTILLANATFERLSGYRRDEIERRMKWMDFVVPEDLGWMLEQHRKRRIDPRSAATRYTFRFVTRSGEVRTVDLVVDMIPGTMTSVASLRDVTEEKRLEEELRSLTEEYQHLLDSMADVYYRTDTEGRLVKASRSWATLLGYDDLSECLGKDIAREFYYKPEDRQKLLDEIMAKGCVKDYEVTLKRRDGTPVTVATSSHLVRDTSGRITGVEGIFRDISQRKQLVDALAEAEQKLSSIIQFLPDATFVIDRNGTVLAWNRAIEEMTGIPASEMVGKGNYEYAIPFYGYRRPILIDLVFTPDSEVEKMYSYVHVEGETLTAETVNASLRGREVVLWGKASPLYNSRGEKVGAIESIRDVTDRKRIEQSLRESLETLRAVMDSIDAGIYVADMQTHEVLFINKYVREDLGEITGKKCWQAIQKDQTGPCPFCTNHLLVDEDGRPTGTYVWEFRNTVTNRWYECHDTAIPWTNGRLVRLDVAIDITDRKQTEEMLRESEEKLRLVNRKLSLLHSITRHDINNQLTMAFGYLDLLKKETQEAAAMEYITKLEAVCKRINGFVRFTRDYEEIGVHEPGWHNCREICEKVVRGILPAHVVILNEIPEEVEIYADPLVEKVFYNLVENALTHGTSVTRIRFSLVQEGKDSVIVVEDDGVGIPPGEKERIFERGYGKGTGFGLFLSREILGITGMSIRETGVFWEGARFEILVPAGCIRREGR